MHIDHEKNVSKGNVVKKVKSKVKYSHSDVLLNCLADAVTAVIISKDFKRTNVNLALLKRYAILLSRFGEKKKIDK